MYIYMQAVFISLEMPLKFSYYSVYNYNYMSHDWSNIQSNYIERHSYCRDYNSLCSLLHCTYLVILASLSRFGMVLNSQCHFCHCRLIQKYWNLLSNLTAQMQISIQWGKNHCKKNLYDKDTKCFESHALIDCINMKNNCNMCMKWEHVLLAYTVLRQVLDSSDDMFILNYIVLQKKMNLIT